MSTDERGCGILFRLYVPSGRLSGPTLKPPWGLLLPLRSSRGGSSESLFLFVDMFADRRLLRKCSKSLRSSRLDFSPGPGSAKPRSTTPPDVSE